MEYPAATSLIKAVTARSDFLLTENIKYKANKQKHHCGIAVLTALLKYI